jgi:circadian clock protein KaiC
MSVNKHKKSPIKSSMLALQKSPSGILGLDEITGGGLPKGRSTLVCGSAGCGKTLFGMEFLVKGATEYNEPGVFIAFEENTEELSQNVASLGFDIDSLVSQKKIALDYIHLDRSEIQETGEYDLEGLFIRIGYAIDTIGAKRIVLDTLEVLFAGLNNTTILRNELHRLFQWLKIKGVTAVITAERGDGSLTRQGLEEYISDCVILLDHRVINQNSTRRIRIVKYRGSSHGTNEYPFLIDDNGFSVLPISSLGLDHPVSNQRISTGIERLDTMLGGKGFYKGSTILLTGTAGAGKSSISSSFINAACSRGERCMYFTFEESPAQIMRNMLSIGLNLEPWVKKGLLQFQAARPTLQGLEMHLVRMHKLVTAFKPEIVIIDPITNLLSIGQQDEVQSVLVRLIDFLKMRQITTLFTSLTGGEDDAKGTDVGISSLVDTWLLLSFMESNGERNRGMYILKSRGMAHSNQIREVVIGSNGVNLADVYVGPNGLLTGAARANQEAKERAQAVRRKQQAELKQRELLRKKQILEAHIASLNADFLVEEEEILRSTQEEDLSDQTQENERIFMGVIRSADSMGSRRKKSK